MRQTLRPYQQEASDAVFQSIEAGLKRVLVVLATGTGKTTIMGDVADVAMMQEWTILITVDRKEIVEDIYTRVLNYCGLKHEFGNVQIGIEMAELHAPISCRIVVACTPTLKTKARRDALLSWLKPKMLIIDEAHGAAAKTCLNLIEDCGVHEGRCVLVGFTATPERGDKKALFARDIDDKPYMLEKGATKKLVPAKPEDCVFEKVIVDKDFYFGASQGWLVDARMYTVKTDTSLEGLVVPEGGDFDEDELAQVVDNAERTMAAITAWKKICPERQTIVYCSSVEHAAHAAELWRQAGFRAETVNGKTEKLHREKIFREFKAGKLDVLTNFGIITKGNDLPSASCIVHLRPSAQRVFVIQTNGRGLRVLPNTIDHLIHEPAQARLDAIAASAKQDCIVIDCVDIASVNVKRLAELIGLPSNLLMEGESLVKTKEKIDDFLQKTGRDIRDCPLSYQDVDVIMKRHVEFAGYRSVNKSTWSPSDHGYRFNAAAPGYSAELLYTDTGKRLVIKHKGTELVSKPVKETVTMPIPELLQKAAEVTFKAIREHKADNPIDRGTSGKMSPKQLALFCRMYRMKPENVDRLPIYRMESMMKSMFEKINGGRRSEQK